NTLAVSEVKAYQPTLRNGGNPNVASAPLPASPADVAAYGGTFKLDGAHTEWVDGKVHETGFTTLFPPNSEVPYVSGGTTYDVDFATTSEGNAGKLYLYAAVTSRSYHTGGIVNALLMDGSVRSVSKGISAATWQALGTRGGNDLVGNDW